MLEPTRAFLIAPAGASVAMLWRAAVGALATIATTRAPLRRNSRRVWEPAKGEGGVFANIDSLKNAPEQSPEKNTSWGVSGEGKNFLRRIWRDSPQFGRIGA